MQNNKGIYVLGAALLILVGALFVVNIHGSQPTAGASVVSAPVFTGGVWVIASSTETFNTSEVSGTFFSPFVNSSSSVGTTATQVLAPNPGRVAGTVCNEGAVNAWLTIATTVTSTVGQSNYFAQHTGRLLVPSACYELTR